MEVNRKDFVEYLNALATNISLFAKDMGEGQEEGSAYFSKLDTERLIQYENSEIEIIE